jgi:hypothetical protein
MCVLRFRVGMVCVPFHPTHTPILFPFLFPFHDVYMSSTSHLVQTRTTKPSQRSVQYENPNPPSLFFLRNDILTLDDVIKYGRNTRPDIRLLIQTTGEIPI